MKWKKYFAVPSTLYSITRGIKSLPRWGGVGKKITSYVVLKTERLDLRMCVCAEDRGGMETAISGIGR